MTNTETITADAALDQLASEGWSYADAGAAIDSLVDSGLDTDRTDDGPNMLTAAEVDIVREQLRAGRDDRG